jgi:hypothetical protein
MILQSSYEATLWAAVSNAHRNNHHPSSNRVFLTLLGGGVFGNEFEWIADAIHNACIALKSFNLDVRIVFKNEIPLLFHDLINNFNQ